MEMYSSCGAFFFPLDLFFILRHNIVAIICCFLHKESFDTSFFEPRVLISFTKNDFIKIKLFISSTNKLFFNKTYRLVS